jgi:hypothetical protein
MFSIYSNEKLGSRNHWEGELGAVRQKFAANFKWNNGMVASGSESLRIGEKNGILGIKSG